MKNRIKVMITCLLMVLMALPFAVMAETAKPAEKISNTLGKPRITSVTRKGSGKTTIYWNKVSGASGFQLQYGSKADYSDAKSVYLAGKDRHVKALKGLSTKKDTYFRIRTYKKTSSGKTYSKWSNQVKMIVWKSSWTYAKNSKIHSDPAFLYYATTAKPKNKTVAINAGHGCKGGESKKTLCHPNGTPKVTGGSTGAGATYATSINSGTDLSGMSEAAANLKIAVNLKTKLINSGYNVLLIRQDSNTQLDNIARTVMANNNANCHIAIHFDSTTSNKGAFYMSVPNVSSYRNMKPVKNNWKRHHQLGNKVISGMRSAGVKIWGDGTLAMDLTQTSYSTIPSIDIEVGDKGTSTSSSNLNKLANGLLKGIKKYF